jgi:YhcH/YjgK/YiaL family protein
MILTTRDGLARYRSLGPRLAAAIDWLLATDLTTLPEGRHPLEGDLLYVICERMTPKPLGPETVWEAHQRYADIQCLAEGAERMAWAPLHESLPVRAVYNPDTDKQLYEPLAVGGLVFDFRAGDAAIFFPEDTHAPCLAPDDPRPVKRVVVKVRLD